MLHFLKPNTCRNYLQCQFAICNYVILKLSLFGYGIRVAIPIRKEARR